MTNKQFVESLDLAWDRRTFLNFVKLPMIIFVRVPLVLCIWFFQWFGEFLMDKDNLIPGLERK